MKELTYSQQWYLKNREKHKAYMQKYTQKHKEYYKIHSNDSNKKIRKSLVNILGDKCVKCGFSMIRILQIDHINGGGLQQIKKFKSNISMYAHYVKNPLLAKEKLQLLCPNCNWTKRFENKETRKS